METQFHHRSLSSTDVGVIGVLASFVIGIVARPTPVDADADASVDVDDDVEWGMEGARRRR